MSGNRPPDPPRYPYDAGALLKAATDLGMRVRFRPGYQGYGWVYCPSCGWGRGENEAEQEAWLLDLSFYQREPWGCAVCRAAEREGRPTT